MKVLELLAATILSVLILFVLYNLVFAVGILAAAYITS